MNREMLLQRRVELERNYRSYNYLDFISPSLLTKEIEEIESITEFTEYDFIDYSSIYEVLEDYEEYYNITELIEEIVDLQDLYEDAVEQEEIQEEKELLLSILKRIENIVNGEYKEKYKSEYEEYILKKEAEAKEIESINESLKSYELEYLYKLLEIAQIELRKKAFPYSRVKKFFNEDIEIEIVETERNTLAYVNAEDLEDGNYTIYLSEQLLHRNSTYAYNLLTTSNRKKIQRDYNKRIINTIKHEILHMYVFDLFEYFVNNLDLGFYKDSSPIFISFLLYLNPKEENGYDSFKEFKKTELYNEVMNCKSFDKVQSLLFKKAFNFVRGEINRFISKQINNNTFISIFPCFADKGKWINELTIRKAKVMKVENEELGEITVYNVFVTLNNNFENYSEQVELLINDLDNIEAEEIEIIEAEEKEAS